MTLANNKIRDIRKVLTSVDIRIKVIEKNWRNGYKQKRRTPWFINESLFTNNKKCTHVTR